MSGQIVKCPGCNIKIQIPEMPKEPDGVVATSPQAQATPRAHGRMNPSGQPQQRKAWKEDPTNPNAKITFGIGLGLAVRNISEGWNSGCAG